MLACSIIRVFPKILIIKNLCCANSINKMRGENGHMPGHCSERQVAMDLFEQSKLILIFN
ncbi:hypothetical protein BpHYR1_026855 [Brachionus plicatilis]|uniref:Uncharacterized protein n=1 Tax=Brachionus plicatilis TaxID=10195 RepID=A0A3M7S765_BRAPC|nr:hypothetical protein BpHYR1_026855 [Brachionus plicatilis]